MRRLVLTDLYLMRWPIVARCSSRVRWRSALMPLGAVSAYVGGVSLICVLVILNIMLVMTAIVQEKKDKVQLFMLSLPISTTQYTLAKLIANAAAFVGCWIVLTAAAVAVIDVSALPNGSVPFLLAVLGVPAALLRRAARRRAGRRTRRLARRGDHHRKHLDQFPDSAAALAAVDRQPSRRSGRGLDAATS